MPLAEESKQEPTAQLSVIISSFCVLKGDVENIFNRLSRINFQLSGANHGEKLNSDGPVLPKVSVIGDVAYLHAIHDETKTVINKLFEQIGLIRTSIGLGPFEVDYEDDYRDSGRDKNLSFAHILFVKQNKTLTDARDYINDILEELIGSKMEISGHASSDGKSGLMYGFHLLQMNYSETTNNIHCILSELETILDTQPGEDVNNSVSY